MTISIASGNLILASSSSSPHYNTVTRAQHLRNMVVITCRNRARAQFFIFITILIIASAPLRIAQITEIYPFQMTSVAVDNAHNIYFTDGANSYVTVFNESSQMQRRINIENPHLSQLSGISLDAFGNIYIADSGKHRIIKLNATGSQVAEFTTNNPPLYHPYGISLDLDGNMYVVDTGNHRIVMLNSMGYQTAVFTTNNPPLSFPFSVSLDATGNMYIADSGNNRVVMLNSSGSQLAIFTDSVSYTMQHPSGVAFDSAGNMYVVDTLNDRIAKLDTNGIQIAMFTTSSPALNRPFGIAVDSDDTMYIADSGNYRIIIMNSTEPQVSFIPSNMTSALDLTFDSADNMFILDSGKYCVVKIDPSGSETVLYVEEFDYLMTGIALDAAENIYVAVRSGQFAQKLNATGSPLAHINVRDPAFLEPTDVVLDDDGNIFISDWGNKRVVKLDPNGILLDEYTTNNPSMYPWGITLDRDGNLYVADSSRIVKFDKCKSVTVFTTSNPSFSGAYYVAVDSTGNIFVSDFLGNRIIKLNSTGALRAVYTTDHPTLLNPSGIAVNSADKVFFIDTNNDRLLTIDADAEYSVLVSINPLMNPYDIAFDSNGNMIIADPDHSRIVKLNPTGTHQMIEFTTSSPSLYHPYGVAVDGADNVYIVDGGNYRIVKLDSNGLQVAVYTTSQPSLSFSSHGVALDSNGNMYITDRGNSRIVKLNSTGSLVEVYPMNNTLRGITVDIAGNIFVADNENGCIVKLNANGSRVALLTASNPSLGYIYGISLDSNSNIYAADSGYQRIVKFNSTGSVVAVFNTSSLSLSDPKSISMDVAGNIYIADNGNGRVIMLNSTGSKVAIFGNTDPSLSLLHPNGIALDSAGNTLIVDSNHNRVLKLNEVDTLIAQFTTSNPSLFDPQGIAVDSEDNMYIADRGNYRVVKLNATGSQVAVYNINNPATGITLDTAGNMFITKASNTILKLNSTGSVVGVFNANNSDFIGLSVDSAGNMYIADRRNDRVVKMNSAGVQVAEFNTTNPTFYEPNDVSLDADGNMYVADFRNRRIVMLNSIGAQTAVFTTSNPALMFSPRAVALDADGNMHISDYNDRLVIYYWPFCLSGHYCPFDLPIICPEGFYCPLQYMYAMSTVTLVACPAGYSCPNGTDSPVLCPLGYYCNGSTIIPVKCAAGTYSNEAGLTTSNCSGICQPGEYCPENANQPLPCPVGAYCPATTELPRPCPAGTYGNNTRLTDDLCSGQCAAGFLCTEYSVTARQQPCPPGTFNNVTGRAECAFCLPGTFAESNANGTLSCTECPRGTYSLAAASQCSFCHVGEYNNNSAQSTCNVCPPGTSAADDAEQRTSCISCQIGYYSSGGGSCRQCPLNTYSLLNGAVECVSCTGIDGVDCVGGIAYVVESYHAAVELHRNSTGNVYVNLTTQRCPSGYCVGTNSSLFVNVDIAGYIASGRSDVVALSLPNQCSENRDQSPISSLCGQCQHGYAPPDVGSAYLSCQLCDGVSYAKVLLFIGSTWLLVILYYTISNGRLGLLGAILYFIQTTAIMVSSQSSLTVWLRVIGFNPLSVITTVCFGPMSPELQYAIPLIIAPMQVIQLVVTVTLHALIKHYWSPPLYQLDELTMAYTISVNDSMRIAKLSRFQFVSWFMSTVVRYRLLPALTVSTVTRTLFLIMTASFTSVMVTCLSWFYCTDNIDIGFDGVSSSVVYAFPAVSCRSWSYVGWSFVMAGYILAWLLIIGLSLCWITLNRRKLAVLQQQSALHDDIPLYRRIIAVTAKALVPKVNSGKSLDLSVPFISQTGFGMYWPTAIDNNRADLDEAVCNIGGRSSSRVDEEYMESRRQYAFRSVFGAMYDSFRPEAIAWNMLIWMRRLLLIVLSVSLSLFPTAKFMSFTFLHLTIFCLQIYYQPYVAAHVNDFEQCAIFIHIVMAVMLTAYPDPTNTTIQSCLLTLTIAPLIVYFLYHLNHHYLYNIQERYKLFTMKPQGKQHILSANILSSTVDDIEMSTFNQSTDTTEIDNDLHSAK